MKKTNSYSSLVAVALCVFMSFVSIINTEAQTVVTDTLAYGTWTKAGSPYLVDTNLFIPDDSTLTIDPGVEVRFRGHYMLDVWGTLNALGTPEDTIVFTVDDTTGFGDYTNWDGSWYGINFNNDFDGAGGRMDDNDTSRIDYCIIEYVNTVREDMANWEQKNGAVKSYFFDRLIISNSVLHRNYSKRGGAIHCGYGYIKIKNNLICENLSFDGGGGLYFTRAFPTLENNIISNNSCTSIGGGIYSIEATLIIVQNIMSNNYSVGGGACYFSKSTNTLLNNTIVYNEANSDPGIKVSSGHIKFINNIVWGNEETSGTVEQVSLSNIPVIDFYNNIIQNGYAAGVTGEKEATNNYNTIGQAPDFVNPSAGIGLDHNGYLADWNIAITSSAINNGTSSIKDYLIPKYDIINEDRINLSKIDIGAFEFHKDTLIVTGDITTNTTWAADTVKIFNNITVHCTILKILPGVVVEMQGYYKFIVNGTVEAVGTKDEPVVFTINDTSGFMNFESQAGGWQGIVFPFTNTCLGAADTSIFKHCIIEYGKKFEDFNDNGGAFEISSFSKLKIEDCEIRNNYADWGGAIKTSSTFLTFKNLLIHHNYTSVTTLYFRSSSNIEMINCYVINNYSDGALVRSGENSYIKFNGTIIANNQKGLYFYYNAGCELINSTICNNSGSHNFSSTPATFKNTIFWDNNLNFNGAPARIEYCNILNGFSGIGSNEYVSLYENNLASDPIFVNPSGGAGVAFDALNADWSLLDISPCINAGSADTALLGLPVLDINGLPRINAATIDMGAHENQGGIPEVTKHPFSGSLCEGDTIMVTVETADTVNYDWQKDGEALGITSRILKFNGITGADQGNYSCIISNAYGSVQSNSTYLNVKQKPYILSDIQDIEACEKDDIQLEVSVTGSVPIFYQWQRGYNNLAGEDNNILSLNTVDSNNAGKYLCLITNECGTIPSDTANIIVHNIPDPDIGKDTILCAYTGYSFDPGNYQFYEWNDYSVNRIKEVTQSGDYAVRVTDNHGCIGFSDTINITVIYPYDDEKICLVTVDTSTNKNMVIWEKTADKHIVAYNLYRQSGFDFDLVATVPYDSASVYVDQKSKPNERAARYALSVIDSCGNESALSPYHQTIHLGSSIGSVPGTIVLDWTDYIDESNLFTPEYYYIYRGATISGLSLVDSISSIYTAYNDLAPEGALYYQVGVKKGVLCDPNNLLKASAGPFSQSLSNLEDNRLKEDAIKSLADEQVQIYPNPARNVVSIHVPTLNSYSLEIMNISGNIVYSADLQNNNNIHKIDVGDWQPGIYLVQVKSANLLKKVKLVIF